MNAFTNRLSQETSPYLLQHAHNPVDWYPWGEEALTLAVQLNKPVLVSIGYAACHWCHVMERESFEDPATAAIMNEHFINIKIDREERPDLDHIYMDAVQAMTGSGGWPLNVFLTPDLKPFFGGTYFPPVRAYNRSSWKEVLYGVATAYKERRQEIEEQANQLLQHLQNANSFGKESVVQLPLPEQELFTRAMADGMYEAVLKTADNEWGGFGRAPKFPQTFTIRLLLQYAALTRQPEAAAQAYLSLDKMMYGGIYDQLGGGFARYSTDTEWLVPHFEKMLYDNALLVMAYAEALQLSGNKEYQQVIHETIAFVQRELMSDEGGFFAALDADSEGVEGKFYTWTKAEIDEQLGEAASLFCDYYRITEQGNWEGVSIPWVTVPPHQFCKERQLEESAFTALLHQQKQQLLELRSKRVRPLLDDKILLGWNALMNSALSKAYQATGEEAYRQLAINNMNFLLSRFEPAGAMQLFHSYKNGKARFTAFLDDYAFLVRALIDLQEITGNSYWLQSARRFMDQADALFTEPETGFYFFTPAGATDVVVRKKEVYDGATPSGNAVMAQNLYYLGLVFDLPQWRERSVRMLQSLSQAILRYPGSFGVWASHLVNLAAGIHEMVVVGTGVDAARKQLLQRYQPNKVLQTAEEMNDEFPLLKGKNTNVEIPVFYICKNYECHRPTENPEDLALFLDSCAF